MDNAELQLLAKAADLLAAGDLVIVPTETVYGLAADGLNPRAVRKIFEAKGRPSSHPLILHVAEVEQARHLTSSWPEEATALARRFWPGPLTLVLPKASAVPDEATGGLDTVAVRMPDTPLSRRLITQLGRPIAAPSANRFTRLSPTSTDQLDPDLLQHVALVLDGGPCRIGIESTVLSLVEEPTILRLGVISPDAIEEVIGTMVRVSVDGNDGRAPGQHPKHYSPTARLQIVDEVSSGGWGLTFGEAASERQIKVPDDPTSYARELYAALAKLDSQNPPLIEVQRVPETEEWAAVRDRLRRAAAD